MPRSHIALVLVLVATTLRAQSPEIARGVIRAPVLTRLGSERLRQANPVTAILYSPDGKQLVTADAHTLRFWDPADGRLLKSIAVEVEEFSALGFTPDGRTLHAATFAGGFTRLCRIDPAAGKVIDHRPLMLGKSIGQFSPNGRWLAMRDESGDELRVFDTSALEATVADRMIEEKFSGVAWRQDSSAVAGATAAGHVRVFDPKLGKLLHECRFEGDGLWSFAFAPGGKDLVAASGSRLVRVATADGKLLWSREVAEVIHPRFSVDGKSIYYCGRVDKTRGPPRWHWLDAETGKPLGITMDAEYALTVAARPDGKVLALGGSDGLIAQWDLATRKRLDASADPPEPVAKLRFSADGKTVRGWARGWYAWDVTTGKQARLTPRLEVGATERIVVSHDHRWLGRFAANETAKAGDPAGQFTLTDLLTGKPARRLDGILRNDVVQFLPAGPLLAFGPSGLRTIDPATGTTLMKVEGTEGARLFVSADGSVAALGAQVRNEVRMQMIDLTTGRTSFMWTQRLDIAGADERLDRWGAALSTDGRRIEIQFTYRTDRGSRDLRFGVFTAAGRKLSVRHAIQTADPVFSPDGRMIAARSAHQVGIDVFEVATGQRRLEMGGLRSMHDCTFGHDGRTLAVSVRPGPIEIWAVNRDDGSGLPAWGPTEADRSWEVLGAHAGEPAFAIICRLRTHPADALPFLKSRMKIPAGPTAEWLAAQLKGLDAPLYRDREKATNELAKAGDVVQEHLWDALATATPEVRDRLAFLLNKAQAMTSDKLRAIRACEVLEAIGSADAQALLVEWSKGSPGATLTREARESLERLKGR
jgi:WD40 repeat protein